MICNAELCIYNERGECRLNEISVNEMGMCDDFIMPTLPEHVLKYWKNETIESLTNDDF